MLTIRDCEILRPAYEPHHALPLEQAMRQIGNPSIEELVEFAVMQMANPDRNVRVLMLRLLAYLNGDAAMRAVLAGLRDDKRRVCAVAIQACPNFLGYDEIVDQLLQITGDSSRKRKLRRRALSMLTGNEGRMRGDLTAPQDSAIRSLLHEPDYRFTILFGLARLDLVPRIEKLLGYFAMSNYVSESVMASRALGGERVIHIDAYAENATLQQEIKDRCDIAHGRMYYWLPRARLPLRIASE